MRDPQAYFSDAFERQLAAEAWKVAANPDTDMFFTWYPPHSIMVSAVETAFQKRVITARNWITGMRDQPSPWGEGSAIERVKSYFKGTGNRDVLPTNEKIANVEHFFTSAMITVVSGAFYAVPSVLVIGYEVILQPIAVGLGNLSLRRAWGNFTNGWKQLAGPDRAGVEFVLMNSNFSALDVQQFFKVEPTITDAVPLPQRQKPAPAPAPNRPKTTPPLQPGQSLSLIAKQLYGSVELWPLVWDLNKLQFPNPNRVSVGAQLTYKDLGEYLPAEIADAKRRSPTWKNYAH